MAAPDAGDRIAVLVETTSPDLLAFFMRRVETAEDAADLLGEALLIIWRRAAAIPADDDEARMWMFGVARNLVATHGRTTRRRSALQDKLRSQLREPAEESLADGVDVRGLLSQLSQIDQEIIRLTYWDGFTQKQAAQMLGMPEGTVRGRHHRARETLRRMLEERDQPRRTADRPSRDLRDTTNSVNS